MHKQSQAIGGRAVKLSLVLITGVFGVMDTPVKASESESIVIAQVGVRSRVSPPIPLNLRPRSHTPLPTRQSIQQYDYNGNPIYEQSRRGKRKFSRFRRRRSRFNRRGRFGRHGRDSFRHRRHRRFRGNLHRNRHFGNHRRRIHHRRNRGNFGGLIIKKKF